MYWLISSFKPFCESNGVHLMREDLKFIEKMLYKIPEERRKRVMKDYYNEWMSGIGSCEIASQKQNLGRRRANNYLRDVCEDRRKD